MLNQAECGNAKCWKTGRSLKRSGPSRQETGREQDDRRIAGFAGRDNPLRRDGAVGISTPRDRAGSKCEDILKTDD